MTSERQKTINEHRKMIRFIIKRIKQINSYDLNKIARTLGYK